MTIQRLAAKAELCAAQADVPSAPLWHIARAAATRSKSNFQIVQDAIDFLTCKARNAQLFDDDEKEFMKELYEALWWGGRYKGFKEAAQLANHYVNGGGKPLRADAAVYSSSVIVTDTMIALKRFVRELAAAGKRIDSLKSSDVDFRRSTHFRAVSRFAVGGRNWRTQGYLEAHGTLLAEQNNLRLKNTDNRFYLQMRNALGANGDFLTSWRVDSYYDFEPFDKADYETHIPLGPDMILKRPDGLSHYISTIGVATEFKYWAEWQESWA